MSSDETLWYWEEPAARGGGWTPVTSPYRPALKGEHILKMGGGTGARVRGLVEVKNPNLHHLALDELRDIFGVKEPANEVGPP